MNTNEDKKMRVAFQGERGAFSEEAAFSLLGSDMELLPRRTFESLFTSMSEVQADYIIAPVENTLAGTVHRSYELLAESNLHVIGEVIIQIRHQLIGCDGSVLDEIRTVESHPVALAQCDVFFASNPQLERIATDDTAASIRRVVESKDKTRAAIGSKRAAKIYGGKILKEHIESHKENYTRFFLLSKESINGEQADKVSLIIRLVHKPAALYHALKPFAEGEINLVKLESYPIRGTPWEYRFYLDLQITPNDYAFEEALEELKSLTTELKILGRYKSAVKGRQENV